ncbi:hypothetical protein F2Q68_00011943 [Brassica cretica]|uniref:Uncharacterized protein n=1 Tax=Brassica cretica TaxID=69181 RepID=A0A8S9KUH9_BRACR|nr:hypothetical protein F2Q68_00011943 [Brassica cretica]
MAANSSSVSVINHMPLSSLRSVSVPLSDRKLPTFRAFSSTAMADAGMDDVQRRLMFEDENIGCSLEQPCHSCELDAS